MAFFGTHNSVTGEKGYGFKNLFRFFRQTQKYTIIEQAKKGVRYFDIKVRKTTRGWVCANGSWETKKTFQEIIREISYNTIYENVYLSITYEGCLPKELTEKDFLRFIKKNIKKYDNLTLYSVSEKYKRSKRKLGKNPIWTRGGLTLIENYTQFSFIKPFPPIPYFWKKENPEEIPSNDKTIIIVDFYDK